jgi:hypothetical protein
VTSDYAHCFIITVVSGSGVYLRAALAFFLIFDALRPFFHSRPRCPHSGKFNFLGSRNDKSLIPPHRVVVQLVHG